MEHSHLHDLKHKGFAHYDSIETALKKFYAAAKIQRLKAEQVPLAEVVGRVLSEDIFAERSIPEFDKSLVDGYALRSADVKNASDRYPQSLRIQGEISLGSAPKLRLRRHRCIRVPTGGFLPQGADSVVMFEEAETTKTAVKVTHPVREGGNTLRAGTDVQVGELLFKKGHRLDWFELGLLASLNLERISVVRRPRVAVLSTGDELIEPGEASGIPDSNRYSLLSAVSEAGCEEIDLGIAKDNLQAIRRKLHEGLGKADMILVSGGSSVGKKDLVPEAVSQLGEPGLVVHGVAVRPGSPAGFAAVKGKPILILPGFPISALIVFYVFGQQILRRMLGASEELLPRFVMRGRLMEEIHVQKGMTSFRPIRVEKKADTVQVYPVKPYGSSIVSSIARADGILKIDSKTARLDRGSMVDVFLLRRILD